MAWSTLKQFSVWGLPTQSIWDGKWGSIRDHLDAAQASILTAFRTAGYDLPIPDASISPEVKRIECVMAGYDFLRVRGWEAKSSEDAEFIKAYERALEWLKEVAKGSLKPLPTPQDSEPEADPTVAPEDAAVVAEPSRGWGRSWP